MLWSNSIVLDVSAVECSVFIESMRLELIRELVMASDNAPSGVVCAKTLKPIGHRFNNGRGRYYWRVGLRRDGKIHQLLAHRIVWMLSNGEIPEGMTIDHIDNDPGNNSISNLRLATVSQQAMNSKRHSGKGTPKGVKKTRHGTYEVSLHCLGRRYGLGTFKSIEEALKARAEAAEKIHGTFHRSE